MADVFAIAQDESVQARFWAQVDRAGGPDACWSWLGTVTHNDNRGITALAGKSIRAPRLALLVAGRDMPSSGMLACHSCDNPNCVNPNHLWWGSHADNMQDASAKRRIPSQSLTHCKHGHEFSTENTRIKAGRRECKVCQRDRNNRHKRRATAAKRAIRAAEARQ